MKQFQQEKNWIGLANGAYESTKNSQFFFGRTPLIDKVLMEENPHYLDATF